MGRKSASCEKDSHLVEELMVGYCSPCVETAKAPAKEKSEKGVEWKGKAEGLKNVELKKQIESLVKQPRIMELIERLKSLKEAVK